ncbi:RNA-binding cell elongation regulator Jag/EloR [Gemelliphila asaccharolytica]|uniref:RNA-binding protein KhpB n=1 Tax=Gemelliphila asaccharolytica TaxID=502393 RepID=A0ABR5TKP3_9BACL|nr:RNA-binding cell elongation regulator Jag/EloR [Gemella asaccharolytica]KXB56404.1 r3H domain protein [Gemella asaccharolytica]
MKKYTYKAENVDEAIKKGLADLNLSEENVKIEVEEAGSKGILGLFKKEAIVKLTPLKTDYIKEDFKKEKNKISPKVVEEKKEVNCCQGKCDKKCKKEEKKLEININKNDINEDVEKNNKNVVDTNDKKIKEEQEKKEDRIVKNKEQILDYMTKIVHSMGYKSAKLLFEEEGNRNYKIKITEVKDTSLLIGKRGNTLNSLQYLANNYGKKFTKFYFRINLDCDDYREKRKEVLEELAINMAKKSKKLSKPIKLEPMTSFERKIIHNALADIKNVKTISVGEEPHRHLIIEAY